LSDPSQPENVAVDESPWRLTGRLDPEDAGRMLSPHLVEGQVLLGNRVSAVPEAEAMLGVSASLALVRPGAVELHLESPREGTSRPRPRVGFELDGHGYDLALTDYLVAPSLMKAGLGGHGFSELGFAEGAEVFLILPSED
jgi:Dual OB-containing domain